MSEFDEGYLAGVEATRLAFAREEPVITLGGIELDRRARVARFGSSTVTLPRIQFLILELLMTGKCISCERILSVVWPLGCESENARQLVSVHISVLRKLLPPGAIGVRNNQGWWINAQHERGLHRHGLEKFAPQGCANAFAATVDAAVGSSR